MSNRPIFTLIFFLSIQITNIYGVEIWPNYFLNSTQVDGLNEINSDNTKMLYVENGCIDVDNENLPYLLLKPLRKGKQTLIIEESKWEALSSDELLACSDLKQSTLLNSASSSTILEKTQDVVEKGRLSTISSVYCLRLKGETLEKLVYLQYRFESSSTGNFQKRTAKSNQANSYSGLEMSGGHWTKFGISETGVQKLSYEQLYIHNVIKGPTPSDWIKVWGDKGDMLSLVAGQDMDRHIKEMSIKVVDGNDDQLDPGDYILFYASAGSSYNYDLDAQIILAKKQYYSDSNFVFLTVNSNPPKRIDDHAGFLGSPDSIYSAYDHFIRHENDWTNFIKSGRTWVGEDFQSINPLEMEFDIETDQQIYVDVNACARSFTTTDNTISLIVNSDTISQGNFSLVSTVYYNDYVKWQQFGGSFNSTLAQQKIKLYYHRPEPSDLAWLDYIDFRYQGPQFFDFSASKRFFNNSTIESPGNFGFELTLRNEEAVSIDSAFSIWAITDYHKVENIPYSLKDGQVYFEANTVQANDFIIFSDNNYKTPTFTEKLEHQSLDFNNVTDFIIVTHPLFEQQAEELAEFHRTQDNMTVQVVKSDHIYNYLSSGRKEAAAIRNFVKHFYNNSTSSDSLKYVLLFGSGSYDPKNRVSSNLDLMPTYQSVNSIKLTASYVTDDFYAALDDGEGEFTAQELLDVGVGRIPSKTTTEAQNVVNKIKSYYSPPTTAAASKGEVSQENSWRNNINFVADDGDFNEHMKQAEILSTMVDTGLQRLNISKTYVDAYLRKETPSGERFPEAHDNILKTFDEGALIVNYTGHGGEYGWGGERFLTVNGIVSMHNPGKLPLVMTATCEFSRFDDPARVSAGEFLILQEEGGAIALFTTVRLVFSIPNFNLNKNLYNELFSVKNDKNIRLGDVFKNTKNRNNAGTNDRNFTLLGDPALRLHLGEKKIEIEKVRVSDTQTDTLSALSRGTIDGQLDDASFDGIIELKIFDKKVYTKALDNEGDGTKFPYFHQEKLLFKGQASVIDGNFSIDFILPKNTRTDLDKGKISFFTSNETKSYSGYSKDIFIGGESNSNEIDMSAPQIELFINDTNFTFGDRVSPSPTLIAHLEDESGIMVSENEIGSSIVLTIDQSNEYRYELNDEYIPSVDNYQKGKLYYELSDVNSGTHTVELQAADNHNNSGKAYTEFVIHENAELALEHVLNYPNPFTTNTGFYFEQNQLDADLDLTIQIYTISGKIIKTIQSTYFADKRLVGPITWDGLDEYGDAIGKGVYLYKITVNAENGSSANHLEKLVILK